MKPLLMLITLFLLVGCASTSYFDSTDARRSAQNWARTLPAPVPPHERPMFIARGPDAGKPMHWSALRDAIRWSHIVVMGERHDDQVGHDIKVEIIRLHRGPGVLAMEQFTRDQQVYLDDWRLDIGVTDERESYEILRSRTQLWPDFERRYLPFIEVGKERGWPIVGSNAPRQYVRMARTEGYAALRKLTPEQRRTFKIPLTIPTGEYRQRFDEVMSGMEGHGHSIDLEAYYRSQVLWDSTMADSVLRARSRHRGSVIFHVNGAFHSDHDGGIIAMLRRDSPRARILNISLVPRDGAELHEEDFGRADIVIYTGAPEAVDESMPGEEEADQVEDEAEEVKEDEIVDEVEAEATGAADASA